MKSLDRESQKLRDLRDRGFIVMFQKSAGKFELGNDYFLMFQGVVIDRYDNCSSEFAILVFHNRVTDGRYKTEAQ